jgi:hypothetical protein
MYTYAERYNLSFDLITASYATLLKANMVYERNVATFYHFLATNRWGSAAHQRGMRPYCLLCTQIFDQPKASYLQLPTAVTPDAKRFSQAIKHLFPSFSAKSVHPSVLAHSW